MRVLDCIWMHNNMPAFIYGRQQEINDFRFGAPDNAAGRMHGHMGELRQRKLTDGSHEDREFGLSEGESSIALASGTASSIPRARRKSPSASAPVENPKSIRTHHIAGKQP